MPATRKKSNASQPAPLLRYSLQRQRITRGVAFSIIVGSCTTYRCICLCCYTHCSRLNGELPKRCSAFSASAMVGGTVRAHPTSQFSQRATPLRSDDKKDEVIKPPTKAIIVRFISVLIYRRY